MDEWGRQENHVKFSCEIDLERGSYWGMGKYYKI
jgi:hypothetical protein